MNENYWEGKATKPTMLTANLGLRYLPKNFDVHRSFDARDWASHFLDTLRENPDIILDHELMVTWFANALMRGYDQRHWETPEYERSVRRAFASVVELETLDSRVTAVRPHAQHAIQGSASRERAIVLR